MSHNVFSVLASSHHYSHPFTCPCHSSRHSLSLSQKVLVVAAAILVGIPTFGVGGVATFYLLSAAFKGRNFVFIDYLNRHPGCRSRVHFFQPYCWGMPVRFPVINWSPSRFGHGRPARGGGLPRGSGHVPVGGGGLPRGSSHVPVGGGGLPRGSGHVPVGGSGGSPRGGGVPARSSGGRVLPGRR